MFGKMSKINRDVKQHRERVAEDMLVLSKKQSKLSENFHSQSKRVHDRFKTIQRKSR